MALADAMFLDRLRVIGTIEGTSTLVLFFVAMPLKYLAGFPLAVSIVGPIHGVLFILLASMSLLAIERVPIAARLGYAGIAAAVFPFGPFVMDRWLKEIAERG